jgi:hypothetical protein
MSTASLKEQFSISIINFSGPHHLWHQKQYASCFDGLTIKEGVFSLCHGKGQTAL